MPMTNEEILQAADNARLLEDALRYAQRGWKIFPLAPRSKLPLIGKRFGGRGVLDATCDEAQIRRWWECQPVANIGVATGDGLVVLDVDVKHGGDETLAALEKTHGTLPKTPLAFTGGGGWHYFFRVEHAIKNSAGKLGTGIDIRGDGGYVVAAGSTHENGRPYAWSLGDHPDETPLAPAPDWLVRLAGGHDNVVHLPQPPAAWRKLVVEGVSEGARNDSLAKLAGHLLRRDVDPLVAHELLLCWNKYRLSPPLCDEEVARTVSSIYVAELRRRGDG